MLNAYPTAGVSASAVARSPCLQRGCGDGVLPSMSGQVRGLLVGHVLTAGTCCPATTSTAPWISGVTTPRKCSVPGPFAGRHSDVLAFFSLVDPCRRLPGEVAGREPPDGSRGRRSSVATRWCEPGCRPGPPAGG